MYTWLRTSAFFVVFGSLSCSAPETSETYEAPDPWNVPQQAGLEGDFYWQDLRPVTQAQLPLGWMGSGLASQSLALAERWAAPLAEIEWEFLQQSTLERQLMGYWKTIETGGVHALALSTAEKYDWLTKNPTMTPELQSEVARFEAWYASTKEPELKDLREKIQDIVQNQFGAIWQRLGALKLELEQLGQERAIAAAEGQLEKVAELDLAIDARMQEVMSLQQQAQVLSAEIQAIKKQIFVVMKDYNTASRQNAAAIAATMPATADAWNEYLRLSTTYAGEWGWFGHCHGAAAASLYEPRTKNAVLAMQNGKEVFFFENDIRNLLVNAWADQAPKGQKYFVGRRCYHSNVELGAGGRPIDGAICSDTSLRSCQVQQGGQQIYIEDNRISSKRILKYKLAVDGEVLEARLVREISRDNYLMASVLPNQTEAANFVVSIRKSCRDVNPMTFHLALTQHIAQGRGIIIDGARDQPVWNAPINGFKVQYLAAKLRDGSLSVPGEPVPVDAIDDPFAAFRAPGTAFVVPIQADLKFHSDRANALVFAAPAPEDDGSMMGYTYTLEFDANMRLIGGEWGGMTESSSEVYQATPDFIWFLPPNPELEDGMFDLRVVKKLRQCAQAGAGKSKTLAIRRWDQESEQWQPGTQDVPYAECVID